MKLTSIFKVLFLLLILLPVSLAVLLLLSFTIGLSLVVGPSPLMANRWAEGCDTLLYVLGRDTNVKCRPLAPNSSSAFGTNCVYEVEFCPAYPRVYWIELGHPLRKDTVHVELRSGTTTNLPVMTVLHNGEIFHRWSSERIGLSMNYGATYGHHGLGEFCVSDFPWSYKERIGVRVELSSPLCPDCEWAAHYGSLRLYVREGYPFW